MSGGHSVSGGFPMAGNIVAAAPARQAYQILHFAFTAAPIIAGIDKFLHILVNWDNYLAPWIANRSPVGGPQSHAPGWRNRNHRRPDCRVKTANRGLDRICLAVGHHHKSAVLPRLLRHRASRLWAFVGSAHPCPIEQRLRLMQAGSFVVIRWVALLI